MSCSDTKFNCKTTIWAGLECQNRSAEIPKYWLSNITKQNTLKGKKRAPKIQEA